MQVRDWRTRLFIDASHVRPTFKETAHDLCIQIHQTCNPRHTDAGGRLPHVGRTDPGASVHGRSATCSSRYPIRYSSKGSRSCRSSVCPCRAGGHDARVGTMDRQSFSQRPCRRYGSGQKSCRPCIALLQACHAWMDRCARCRKLHDDADCPDHVRHPSFRQSTSATEYPIPPQVSASDLKNAASPFSSPACTCASGARRRASGCRSRDRGRAAWPIDRDRAPHPGRAPA